MTLPALRKARLAHALVACVIALQFAAGAAIGAPEGPQAVVRHVTDRFLGAIQLRHAELKSDPERLYRLVDEIVMPAIDIDYVTRLILAKHWRRIDDGQRQRFQEAYRRLLLRTYGTPLLDALEDPSQLQISYQPNPPGSDPKDAVVRTEIRFADRPAVRVDYRMRVNQGQWKAYDVIIAGVSSVITNRSTVSERIQTQGIEQLISDLEARAAGKVASDQPPAPIRP
jgi:phospholipid transport system substrate-binding protein